MANAPEQVQRRLPVSEHQAVYGAEVAAALQAADRRAELDVSNESPWKENS